MNEYLLMLYAVALFGHLTPAEQEEIISWIVSFPSAK